MSWTDSCCDPPAPSPPGCVPVPCPPGPPPWFSPPTGGQAPWYPGANGGVSFSLAEPLNPVRGHFWWNGTVLSLFDGVVWVAIGPGV